MAAPAADVSIVALPGARKRAERLARRLGLPLLDAPPAPGPLLLEVAPDALRLRDSARPRQHPLRIDFDGPLLRYRVARGGGVRQALARAVGVSGARPRVLDATAGLGRDAFVLAALGCPVTLLERHPVLAALLRDGLARAAHGPATADIVARMQLLERDAVDYLTGPGAAHDVIYLDPMYPPRRKQAAVRKDMRLLQALLGDDGDPAALLRAARRCPGRVVVKRPGAAPPLADAAPSATVRSANTRYDIYLERTDVEGT